jgi:ligand-binding sensor domain-containing protein
MGFAPMIYLHKILSVIRCPGLACSAPALVLFSILFIGCNELPDPPVEKPQWSTFKRGNIPSLPSDHIKTLFLGRDNTVWIGTDSGAVAYKKGWRVLIDSLQYLLYNSDGSTSIAASINTIAESKDGSIWFGTAAGGVRRYNATGPGKTWIRYSRSTDTDLNGVGDLSDNTIFSIVGMQSGTPAYIYVGSFSGVDRYTPDDYRPTSGIWDTIAKPLLPDTEIVAIAINPASTMICFGTKFHGAAFLDESINDWSYYKFPPKYDYPISSIAFDPWSDIVWLGKWEGVTRYDMKLARDSSFTNENTSGSLPPGIIHAVAIEATGSTWLGTDMGLVHYTGSAWIRYTQQNTPALPSDIITSLIFDYAGNLWIGTTRGIAVYNPNGTAL